jgi:hypothetical protein
MGRVDVFSGGLKARSVFLKMTFKVGFYWVVFVWYFHWCSAYIRRLCFVTSLLSVFVRLVQRSNFY